MIFCFICQCIHTMTAPIIQQQQQPSSTVESVDAWNNYDWTPTLNNATSSLNNVTNAVSNYNSEDYEEMAQESNGEESNGEESNGEESNEDEGNGLEGNGMMTQEEEDYIMDDSSSYTSEDVPELEEVTNIFENPANSLDWRDRHIERNFCSYNEFHDYITAYHIEYNEYFGLPQQ